MGGPTLEYWLIAFIIFVVLSPLAWLKSSPAQLRITAFRKRALALGLRVQLAPPIDAPPDEKRPSAARYSLPLSAEGAGVRPWALMRDGGRGWESPWPGWRWLRQEAPASLHPAIEPVLARLPGSVTAVRVEPRSLSLYVEETGDPTTVDRYDAALRELAQRLGAETADGRQGSGKMP